MRVPFTQIQHEAQAVMRVARLPSYPVVQYAPLDAEHARNPRRYAQVRAGPSPRMEVARAIQELPPEQRLGLYAHEVGHFIWPSGGEVDADMAAEGLLGVRIGYDRRWPGKGLQTAVLAPKELWRIVGEPQARAIRAANGFRG